MGYTVIGDSGAAIAWLGPSAPISPALVLDCGNNNDAQVIFPLGSANPNRSECIDPYQWSINDYEQEANSPRSAWVDTPIPPGHAIMLPPGTYLCRTMIRTNPQPWPVYSESPLKFFNCYLDQAEYDGPGYPWAPDETPPSGWYYEMYNNAVTIASAPPKPYTGAVYAYQTWNGYVTNDTTKEQPFFMAAYAYGQTTDLSIDYWGLLIHKIA